MILLAHQNYNVCMAPNLIAWAGVEKAWQLSRGLVSRRAYRECNCLAGVEKAWQLSRGLVSRRAYRECNCLAGVENSRAIISRFSKQESIPRM